MIAAARARGEPVDIADFAESAIPDNQNAAILFQRAATAIDVDSDWYQKATEPIYEPPFSLSDIDVMQRVAADSAPARQLLAQARKFDQAQWDVKLDEAMDFSVRRKGFNAAIGPQRDLTEHLLYVMDYFHAVGEDGQAISLIRDMVHQAKIVNAIEYGELSQLSAEAIYEDTAQHVFWIAPSLCVAAATAKVVDGSASASDVHQLIADFLAAMPNSDAIRAILENRAQMLAFYATPQFKLPMDYLPDCMARLFRPAVISTLADGFRMDSEEALSMRRPTLAEVAALLPKAKNTLARRMIRLAVGDKDADHFAPQVSDLYSRAFFTGQMYCRFAAIALAVRLYCLEHQKFPDDLQQLVPDYLPAVPLDPFSLADARMKYDLKQKMIYSMCDYPATRKGARIGPFAHVSLLAKRFATTAPVSSTRMGQ